MFSRRSALVIIGLSVLGLLAWRSGASAYMDRLFQSKQYIEACKTVEVRFIRKPRTPVRSVALDYLPHTPSEPKRRYEFNASGRVERVGTVFWQPRLEQQVERFELRTQYGKDKPEWQFYRYEGQVPPYFVGARSAEVLVVDTISHSEELLKPLWQQGMVEHRLKVTDLRNGDELAEMSYVVDLKSQRACGTNTNAAIDVDLFILQAVAAPIVIPEHERQRRERAVIKNW
jgi:hypothetical protein